MSTTTAQERVLRIARRRGILRPRDLDRHGFSRSVLRRLHHAGLVVRLGRGLYAPADSDLSEHQTVAEAAVRIPTGVDHDCSSR